jgi:pilus assembly protein CpaB
MKAKRLIVLGVAVVAGGAAMLLASAPRKAPTIVVAPQQEPLATNEVLVTAIDIPMGHRITANDLKWQPWTAELPGGSSYLTRTSNPSALQDSIGAMARHSFLRGEPVQREKLIKVDGGSGFMSAVLPAGMRAMSVAIDNRGTNTAGGFILPNDRVDVLRTYRDDEGSRGQGLDVYISETILSNIRILAIGQNIQERNGEKVVTGENATLELTPAQAEVLLLAQRVGQLSLALRSIADASQAQEVVRSSPESGLTVVRYGVPKQTPKR